MRSATYNRNEAIIVQPLSLNRDVCIIKSLQNWILEFQITKYVTLAETLQETYYTKFTKFNDSMQSIPTNEVMSYDLKDHVTSCDHQPHNYYLNG